MKKLLILNSNYSIEALGDFFEGINKNFNLFFLTHDRTIISWSNEKKYPTKKIPRLQSDNFVQLTIFIILLPILYILTFY